MMHLHSNHTDSHLQWCPLLLPGTKPDGDGQKLSRGLWQNLEGMSDLVTIIEDHRVGGGGHTYFGEVLIVIGPGDAPFWVRDMYGAPCMENILGGFHHRVAWWVTGKIPRKNMTGFGTTLCW